METFIFRILKIVSNQPVDYISSVALFYLLWPSTVKKKLKLKLKTSKIKSVVKMNKRTGLAEEERTGVKQPIIPTLERPRHEE